MSCTIFSVRCDLVGHFFFQAFFMFAWIVLIIRLKNLTGKGRAATSSERKRDPFEIWEASTTPRDGFSLITITGKVLSGVAHTRGVALSQGGAVNYRGRTKQYSLQVMRIWLRNEVVQSIGSGYFILGKGSSIRASRLLLNTNAAYEWTVGENLGRPFMLLSLLLMCGGWVMFVISGGAGNGTLSLLSGASTALSLCALIPGFKLVRPILKRVTFLELEEGYAAPEVAVPVAHMASTLMELRKDNDILRDGLESIENRIRNKQRKDNDILRDSLESTSLLMSGSVPTSTNG